MGRHERRASLAAFRREAAGELITHLIDANEPLDGHPLLKRAAAFWRGQIKTRKPVCIACRKSFAEDGTAVGGFLFATSASADAAGTASVSGVCTGCWTTLPMAEIEDHTLRVMAKLLRGARFQQDAS